ncbi:hypothetical protein [Planctomicrobium sp. SH664]|uniref:carboxylesterase family protein n=1 Tax=Planctomicrobium sp. SH664 TaxID=3448125 RepID=UPI003F5C6F17
MRFRPRSWECQLVCLLTLTLVGTGSAWGQSFRGWRGNAAGTANGQFVNRTYRDEKGEHKYVVFVPVGYTPSKKWPTVLYLHGAQSRGKDGRAQLVSGLAPAIKLRMNSSPYLAVFPQCEQLDSRLLGGWTDDPEDADRALRILDEVEKEYSVDRRREILMGASMGGTGVWAIGARTADRWAALVPADAFANIEDAPKLANVPIWAFHAQGDPLISIDIARNMVDAVNKAGGRAYLSEITIKSHANSGLTFTQPALQSWILDPSKEPNLNLEWKVPAGYSEGLEEEMPFVTGAEIAGALRLQVGTDMLESLAYAIPPKAAEKPMAGWVPNVHESRQVGLSTFDISMTGMHYRGQLERALITPLSDNRLQLQLGLRNVTMTVSNSQINGRLLFSASAGPMHIVIGHRAPVWLNIVVRPRVENRQFRLDLLGVGFQIPDNNWYVTEPNDARVRGMPLLNRSVSNGIVDGVYSKKHEIEQQVRSSVSSQLPKMVADLNAKLSQPIRIGEVALPVIQPRLKFWPEEVTVTEQGLTLVMGAAMGVLGQPEGPHRIRYYTSTLPEKQPRPEAGAEVAISEQLITAWTELIVRGRVNCIHAVDLGTPELAALRDRQFLEYIVPDLKRFGPELQTNYKFVLLEPIGISDLPPILADSYPAGFSLTIPRLQMTVTARESNETHWQDVAHFELWLKREHGFNLQKPGFAGRSLQLLDLTSLQIRVDGRFAEGYVPVDPALHLETLKTAFVDAIEAAHLRTGGLQLPLKDVDLIGMPLRLEDFVRQRQMLTLRGQVPGILITNDTNETLTYEVRGPFSRWESHTLAPNRQHEFHVPYPLMWRQQSPAVSKLQTLPLGQQAACRLGSDGRVTLVPDDDDVAPSASSTAQQADAAPTTR